MGLVERILNRLFNKREIHNCDGDVYLHRWYVIRTLRFGLFIHKFVRSDEDRALHDHPWSFIVIPIWRGYIEHNERCLACNKSRHQCSYGGTLYGCDLMKPNQIRVYPIIGTRYRPAEYRHRVELLTETIHTIVPDKVSGGGYLFAEDTILPAWSIFIRFRKRRAWGFWEKQGFIHNETWWNEKCE